MPKLISVTSLSSYLYCSRKLFLERVLRLVSPPKKAIITGTICHTCYEKINKIEETIVKTISSNETLNDIKHRYSSMYSSLLKQTLTEQKYSLKPLNTTLVGMYNEIFPILEQEAEVRAKKVSQFIIENKIYGQELWDKLTPKIKSEVKLSSPTLGLIGVVDQLEISSDSIVPIELKTGSVPKTGTWPSHRIQTAAYMALLQEVYKQEIRYGFVYYLDKLEKRRITNNSFIRDEVIDLKNKVSNLLTSNKLPDFVKNKNKCVSCSLKDKCYDSQFMQQRMQLLLSKSLYSSH
jgi:CRISPR-associated protein Cas4